MPDQVQGTTVKTGTGKSDPDLFLIFADIAAQAIMIHTEAAQGHIRIIAATTGAAPDAHAPLIELTAIDLAMTHHTDHIADQPHIEVHQLTTQEIAVDHPHDHPTIFKVRLTQVKLTVQQTTRQSTPQEEPEGKN